MAPASSRCRTLGRPRGQAAPRLLVDPAPDPAPRLPRLRLVAEALEGRHARRRSRRLGQRRPLVERRAGRRPTFLCALLRHRGRQRCQPRWRDRESLPNRPARTALLRAGLRGAGRRLRPWWCYREISLARPARTALLRAGLRGARRRIQGWRNRESLPNRPARTALLRAGLRGTGRRRPGQFYRESLPNRPARTALLRARLRGAGRRRPRQFYSSQSTSFP